MTLRIITGILLILGIAILAFGLVPIVGSILGTNVAEGVVGDIRLATDLNPWLEKALLALIGVIATAIFVKCHLSLSWNKQLIGSTLISLIWITAYGFLALKTSDPIEGPWFNTEGKPLRCYVLDGRGVRLLYLVDRDPKTGQVCLPVNVELEPQLRQWLIAQRDAGGVLQLQAVPSPSRFFGFNGVPLVWFYRLPDGTCEYFDLPGVHPEVGVPLNPITSKEREHCRAKENNDLKAEGARAVAVQASQRRDKYVGATVQPGSAILATSGLGPLADAALESIREGGHVVVLKPAFVEDGLFDRVWNGGNELSTLGLETGNGALLVRPSSEARITKSPELNGFTSIQQSFSMYLVRAPFMAGEQLAGFNAEGRGFSIDTARTQFRSDFVAQFRNSLGVKLKGGR